MHDWLLLGGGSGDGGRARERPRRPRPGASVRPGRRGQPEPAHAGTANTTTGSGSPRARRVPQAGSMATDASRPDPPTRFGARRWLLLIMLCASQFMVALDFSIVSVALPAIGHDLGFTSTADLQWVMTAFILFIAGFLLLFGRASDLFGRRRLFLIGVALFTVFSLAGGL